MKRIIAVLALLCPFLLGAQETMRPLTVGDPVPDLEVKGLVNYPSPSLRLSQFRGKALILDFWATWCSACLKGLERADSLQQRFGDSLQVVMVSTRYGRDDAVKVQAFLDKRRQAGHSIPKLPFVTSDTVLNSLFPHRTIPHYVWLNRDGVVAAITSLDELTEEHVRRFLQGEALNLPLKREVMDYRVDRGLLEGGNGGAAAQLQFRSIFTGQLPGMSSGSRSWRDSTVQKRTLLNLRATDLYRAAHRLPTNRVIMEAKLRGEDHSMFCYELTAPAATTDLQFRALMLQDLNRYLNLNGRIEKRAMPCWVLVRKATGDHAFRSRGGAKSLQWYTPAGGATVLRNRPLATLIAALNGGTRATANNPIVLDETGYSGPVDLELRAPLTDLPALRRELQRYGLDLIPAVRKVEVFVLGKENAPPALKESASGRREEQARGE